MIPAAAICMEPVTRTGSRSVASGPADDVICLRHTPVADLSEMGRRDWDGMGWIVRIAPSLGRVITECVEFVVRKEGRYRCGVDVRATNW